MHEPMMNGTPTGTPRPDSFAALVRSYMNRGTYTYKSGRTRTGAWDLTELAEALAKRERNPGGRDKSLQIETIKKKLRNVLLRGQSCHRELARHLCDVFLAPEDIEARTRFLDAHEALHRSRYKDHGNAGVDCGLQVPDEIVLREVHNFDKDFYDSISYELFEEWYEACPSGFLCAFRNKEPVAVVGLFPVTPIWARLFLARKVDEADLTGKIIKAALESRSGYLYFSGLSSKLPERSLRSQLPRILGFAILRWLRDNAAELGKQQLCIVAEGATDQGIRLLDRQFGFKLISGGIGSKDPEKSKQKPRFRRTIQVSRIPDLLGSPFFERSLDLRSEADEVRGYLRNLGD